MSLTSYRAAPPRVNPCEKGKRGIIPAPAAYVAIMTRLEKPTDAAFVAMSGNYVVYFSNEREARLAAERGGGGGVARRGP